MSNVIRAADLGDLAGLRTLYRELRPADPELHHETAVATMNTLLSHPGLHLVVCEQDGTLVSTCMLAIVPNLASGARPFGLIEHVVTLPSHRRKGIGRAVLEHALQLAWSNGCYKVVLLSGAHRTQAHALYESVGFRGDVERGFVVKAGA